MRLPFLLAVLTCLTVPAYGDPGLETKVRGLLSGYEFVPTQGDWDKLGPGAAEALAALVDAPAGDLVLRARAVSSLAHFPTPEVRKRLELWLADGTLPELLRRKAAAALGAAFGADAMEALEKARKGASPKLAETIDRSLGVVPAPTGP